MMSSGAAVVATALFAAIAAQAAYGSVLPVTTGCSCDSGTAYGTDGYGYGVGGGYGIGGGYGYGEGYGAGEGYGYGEGYGAREGCGIGGGYGYGEGYGYGSGEGYGYGEGYGAREGCGIGGGYGYGEGYGYGSGYGAYAGASAGVATGTALVATPVVAYKEGLCPGKVVERDVVVNKPVTEAFRYRQPVYSKSCYTKPAGVARTVVPSAYSSPTVCDTQETVVKVPTTDVEVRNQPLCKKTCTTSQYLLQIPIVETTCHQHPLCQKTVRAQNNLLTTVSKKTTCAKTRCSQAKVVETPLSETVCQGYRGSVDKFGTKTYNRQEVVKTCTQLPPVKCLKPTVGTAITAVPTASAYGQGYAGFYGGQGEGYGQGCTCGCTCA